MRTKQALHSSYQSMPAKSRFGIFNALFYNEAWYTAQEMQLRSQILTARSQSGLDPSLLETSVTWFNSNLDIAFLSYHENSWFFEKSYLPRSTITKDDFHIEFNLNQHPKWAELSTMRRFIADYLIVRNEGFAQAYLNQPMNYLLLDVIQILNRLSMRENPEHVLSQLEQLQQYLRSVEINISPTVGSDRLFLADCRENILAEQESFEQQIGSQRLITRVLYLQQHLTHIAELRNTVLHFALAAEAVNPHPYWDYFKKDSLHPDFKRKFPTLMAKDCVLQKEVETKKLSLANKPVEDLSDCPHLKLVEMTSEMKHFYYQAIKNLEEMLHFQQIFDELSKTFEKAGEIITLLQFREQLEAFLDHIELFMQRSQSTINQILNYNSNFYHQTIKEKQNLSLWDKWLTSKQAGFNTFIKNQDYLARFRVTVADLQQANKKFIAEVQQIKGILNEHVVRQNSIVLISSTQEDIFRLMQKMEAFVPRSSPLIELEPRKILKKSKNSAPLPGKLSPPSVPKHSQFTVQPTAPSRPGSIQFLPAVAFFKESKMVCEFNQSDCQAMLPTAVNSQSTIRINGGVIIYSFMILLPAILFLLKLIYDSKQKKKMDLYTNREEYEVLHIATADLISRAINTAEQLEDNYWLNELALLAENLTELTPKKTQKNFPMLELKTLNEDLVEFLRQMQFCPKKMLLECH